MPITYTVTGSFNSVESFLKHVSKLRIADILDSCGQQGVSALQQATPVSSGLAALSWTYEVGYGAGLYTITWLNTDIENGFPVAIMLQYGYGTGTGGYVQGRDYINPAMKPVFDTIADKVWKAVTSTR